VGVVVLVPVLVLVVIGRNISGHPQKLRSVTLDHTA
jgi:hypothetical protein